MLQAIDWRITHACNNQCLYCYGNKPIKRISPADEAILLEKIVSAPIKVVNITGGEPLLNRERCFHIIRTLSQSGKKIYLSTNATDLVDHLDFISENVALLGLPLDGYDDASNQINGRAVDAFDLVKNVLDANKKRWNKIDIKIGTVITKKNLDADHLTKMCNFLMAQGIRIWRIYEMIPVNRGADNRDALELTDADRNQLVQLVSLLQSHAPSIKIELATRASRASAYFIIQPDGSVILPTDSYGEADERLLGNLLTESFDDIYRKWGDAAGMDYSADYMQMRTEDVCRTPHK